MTGMLASVENLEEALLVLEAGADIIDLKAPSAGALGALPIGTVREIVIALRGRRPISATIGDLPMEPALVLDAAGAMAKTGVDYVKIGFFPGGDWEETMFSLSLLANKGIQLVAVLFGDQQPALIQIGQLAAAGFTGVMLDTQDKATGSLVQVCPMNFLREFVAGAKTYGLLCGLAGSLRHSDIPLLLDLCPDYLGFRGALCVHNVRTSGLDRNSVLNVRAALPS